MRRKLFLTIVALLPFQGFCSFIIREEDVETEIADIKNNGGVIEGISISTINEYLKEYKIKYRTADEISLVRSKIVENKREKK